jgi:hypothetical protein
MQADSINNTVQLGHSLGEFGWNKGRAKALLGVWLLLLVICLPLSLVLIGLPGFIASAYFVYRSLRRLKDTKPVIILYQDGLVDCRQGQPVITRYQDITNLFLSVVVRQGILNYVVTLETHNKKKIKIDEHVADISHLRTLLEEQLVQLQLPNAIASYRQGQPLKFGPLTLTQEGLSVGKRMLPWTEFEAADVQRRGNYVVFFIRQKDHKNDWYTTSRDIFPNLALFFALVSSLTK